MTIPQIEETIGKLNHDIDRIDNTLRDFRDDINELREQLGVQRPDKKLPLSGHRAGTGAGDVQRLYPTPSHAR